VAFAVLVVEGEVESALMMGASIAEKRSGSRENFFIWAPSDEHGKMPDEKKASPSRALLIRDLFTAAIRWHPCSDRPPSQISSDVTDPSHARGQMRAYTERVPQGSPFISSQEGGVPMFWKRVFHGVSRGVNPHCAQVIHSPARLREPQIKARFYNGSTPTGLDG
jgi:hypothetical protein